MCDFYIETTGAVEGTEQNVITHNNDSSATTSRSLTIKEILADYKTSLINQEDKNEKKKSNSFFEDMGWTNKKQFNSQAVDKLSQSQRNVQELLKKSVITPEFETLHSIPPFEVSRRKLKFQKMKERSKTKGQQWYGLPATEMTPEVKNDLEILQMRSVLDPKRFYKKNDLKVLPKYFQVGKVLDSPLEYYNNRLTKKERKKTLVDELLADAEFNKYNKRKYKEIIEEKQKTHYKEWRKSKKLKKKNK